MPGIERQVRQDLSCRENSGKLTQRLGGRYWAESIRFPECSTNGLWTAQNYMVTMASYITGHKIGIFTNGNSYTFSQMVTLRHVYVNWFDCGNFFCNVYILNICVLWIFVLKFSTNTVLLNEKCAWQNWECWAASLWLGFWLGGSSIAPMSGSLPIQYFFFFCERHHAGHMLSRSPLSRGN